MIPEKFVEFIQGPCVTFVGARDEELRPSVSWVFGAVADAESETITFFLPDMEGEPILRNLAQNGRVSLTMTDGPSHESYQFKGKHVASRPSGEEEMAFQDNHRSNMMTHYKRMGIPEEFFGGFVYHPSTAVTFRVEEIFVQTPGPGAGEKIDFAPKA